MLDKSLVYKDIVMCLPFEDLSDLRIPVLPDGYSYKMLSLGMRLLGRSLKCWLESLIVLRMLLLVLLKLF